MPPSPYTSLYVHVPFCNRKCDYCAFYSLGHADPDLRRRYLDRLRDEFDANAGLCAPLDSIFIGGGTPTALAPGEMAELLHAIRTTFTLAPDCEWSSEANPESLTPEMAAVLAEGGVNRVSVGIQSFIPHERQAIGRRGSLDRLADSLDCLRRRHVDNLNLDLMFLLPGQTPDSFARSLRQALDLHPTHLSAYALTIEEHSILARRHPHQPDDELFVTFWDTADRLLATAGLQRYEISNFALPGRRCRHNDDIWHGATYLGCGPSATSFDGLTRFTQPHSLNAWLHAEPPERDELPPPQRACEILAFGMRTLQGWNFDDFTARTGFDALDLRGNQLRQLRQRGLITLSDTAAAPTRDGLLFNDDLLIELI